MKCSDSGYCSNWKSKDSVVCFSVFISSSNRHANLCFFLAAVGIITTVRKVHVVRKIENSPVQQICEAKVYKEKQILRQQNCTAVWHRILIMLFSKVLSSPQCQCWGGIWSWDFGAALCGFFSTQERMPLPGELSDCICFNPMCSAVGVGQESRFQFYLLCPLCVLYI